MTDPNDSAERAVAIAMFTATGDETDGAREFDALPQEDRDNMLAVATAGMAAHLDWLTEHGFRIAPPGTMLRPKTEDDAKAMMLAARDFLAKPKGKKALIASPGLILPGRAH